MKKEKFEEFLKELEINKNEWIIFYEVESFILTNGAAIYPNWKHIRFLVKDNCDILVQHGNSKPYGARLNSVFQLSQDRRRISFPPKNPITPSQYYGEFRYPKIGDILRASDGTKVINEIMIENVVSSMNSFSIYLHTPLFISDKNSVERILFSFYDPLEYVKEKSMHSTIVPGVYMKFFENPGKNKKEGIYHETIKLKDIQEITLKVRSQFNNKEYKIKE